MNEDVRYLRVTFINNANKDVQYKRGTSPRMIMYCVNKSSHQ